MYLAVSVICLILISNETLASPKTNKRATRRLELLRCRVSGCTKPRPTKTPTPKPVSTQTSKNTPTSTPIFTPNTTTSTSTPTKTAVPKTPTPIPTTTSTPRPTATLLPTTAAPPAPTAAPTTAPTTVPTSTPSYAGLIVIEPGQNIQAVVDAYPEGTGFFLKAGYYRLQSIRPKRGNSFIGEYGTILSGAAVLSNFVKSSNIAWSAPITGTLDASAPAAVDGYSVCFADQPLCHQPHDVFLDNVRLSPVGSVSALSPGKVFVDYLNRKVHLAEDPQGKVVEIGLTPYAFENWVTGVAIKSMTIEKYASRAQSAAVRAANGWRIEGTEIRQNHGSGVQINSDCVLRNNLIHNNGQIGVTGSGARSVVEQNEIAYNNYARYNFNFEAGGSKFAFTTSYVIRANLVHDNDGPGLWTDIDNFMTLYEGNYTFRNKVAGIFHEISFGHPTDPLQYTIIRNNFVSDELPPAEGSTAYYAAGIRVLNSSGVHIYGNTITNCSNGIGISVDAREGTASYTVPGFNYRLSNVLVHDNTIRNSVGIDMGPMDAAWYANRQVYFSQ